MSVSEVLPGMKGEARTVFQGTEIQSFPIKVLGVLKNNKFSDKLVVNGESVLVQASGSLIEKSGGIAAGMSGAPVYIKGKLLGALSAGWTLADHTVGLVTPIEDMLRITRPPYFSFSTSEVGYLISPPVNIKGKTYDSLITSDHICSAPSENTLVFQYVKSPLMVSGIKPGLFKLAGETFTSYPSDVPATHISETLEPGSALGVQIVRGDINITTLGTLTYIDREKGILLAFGHPFLHKGDVDFFLSGAYIYHSFSSIDMPFKVGAPLDLIGRVVQDRQEGIAGQMGKRPVTVPLKFTVQDQDHNLSRQLNVEIVQDASILCDVLNAISRQALDETVNYVGPLSINSSFTLIYSAGSTMQDLKYSNLSYSTGADETVTQDLIDTVNRLTDNEFCDLKINRIEWNLSVTRVRKTARITGVKFPSRNVSPGEIIGLNVSIKPYRGTEFIKTVFFKLPENVDSSANLIVRGGKTCRSAMEDLENFGSLEVLIESLKNYPLNSDIVISCSLGGESESAPQSSLPLQKTASTEYILEGYFENIVVFEEQSH